MERRAAGRRPRRPGEDGHGRRRERRGRGFDEFDIVLIYDGAHYNALPWKRSAEEEEDHDAHEEQHFEGDFGDIASF